MRRRKIARQSMNKSKFINAILFSLVVIIITSIGFVLISEKPFFGSKKPKKEYEAGRRRFGKQVMMVYPDAMSGGVTFKDPNRLEGDYYSKLYFDAKITPNNCIVLVNRYHRPETHDYISDGNRMIVRLDASVKHQQGKVLKAYYENGLNGSYSYSVHEGEQFGLTKYVSYMREGGQPSPYTDYLVTMKASDMPLRLLEVTTPRPVKGNAGGVYHYFMYSDWVQVKIHYRKIYLKDWQRIETAMRQFIDKLYAEAKQHDILYYSDTSNAITRHCQ